MAIFKGAGVAIVTPMKENLEVNYDKLDEILEEQIAGGTDAIIICGTTGESATMTEAEHSEAIRFTVERVKHRIPVIAGTGSNCTRTAMQLSTEAEKDGADGLLLVTPYYNKATQNGLIAHYTQICSSVSIPAILYNVPSRTGCSIQPQTLATLVKNVDNIVGVKEASGNIGTVAEIMHLCDGNIDLYSGNDDQVVPLLSLGGIGVISVLSNIAPAYVHIPVRRRRRKRKNAAGCDPAGKRPLLRSKPDPGQSSHEHDGQRSRAVKGSADRNGRRTQRSIKKSNDRLRSAVRRTKGCGPKAASLFYLRYSFIASVRNEQVPQRPGPHGFRCSGSRR